MFSQESDCGICYVKIESEVIGCVDPCEVKFCRKCWEKYNRFKGCPYCKKKNSLNNVFNPVNPTEFNPVAFRPSQQLFYLKIACLCIFAMILLVISLRNDFILISDVDSCKPVCRIPENTKPIYIICCENSKICGELSCNGSSYNIKTKECLRDIECKINPVKAVILLPLLLILEILRQALFDPMFAMAIFTAIFQVCFSHISNRFRQQMREIL